MDKIILEDNIYYYKNIFDNLDDILNYVKDTDVEWKDWYASDSNLLYGKYIGGEIQLVENIYSSLKNTVFKCLYDYCLNTNKPLGFVPNFYKIQKYNTNAYMGPHVDSIDKTAEKTPTISIVIYLNDDYEGGEIKFPNQDIFIKPEAGSMIIFPSYEPYVHDPQPTKSGDKYMSPVFCFKEPF